METDLTMEEKTQSVQPAENLKEEPANQFIQFLDEMGLSTPIDSVFQIFAIQKSRQLISKMKNDELLFLFHVLKNKDLKEDFPFPRCAFIEKILSSDSNLPPKYIIWTVEESSLWKTRKPLSFNDFHLYFQDVLRPNFGYSAEELYKVFDAKHDDTYFINNGPRSGSVDNQFHVLFVTEKIIVAIQMPEVKYEEISDTECFMSKWVSLDCPVKIQECHESAVFLFPRKNLVFSEEEKKEYVANMEIDDCPDCAV